jgi:hypothetical protein
MFGYFDSRSSLLLHSQFPLPCSLKHSTRSIGRYRHLSDRYRNKYERAGHWSGSDGISAPRHDGSRSKHSDAVDTGS